MVIPGPGKSLTLSLAASGFDYGLIGPFGPGVVLRRLWATVAGDSTGGAELQVWMGASFGGKRSADASGLDAGASVLQASPALLGRTPAWATQFSTPHFARWVWPIGVLVFDSPTWFVCGLLKTGSTGNGSVSFAVETVLSGKRGGGGPDSRVAPGFGA